MMLKRVTNFAVVLGAAGTLWIGLARAASGAAPGPGSGQISYNRDVRPILSDNCFACHGPDKSHRKGKLRLDDADAVLEKKAIVPGKPAESGLIERILSDDKEMVMPPPEAHKTLSAAQKDVLRRWVEQGGKYEPHWAYITPMRPATPVLQTPASSHNPIDAFILGALESKGLRPSPQADRATLLRRLSLDLVGLPPTPQEVDAFVNDKSADAYEKQVDRLLASPHFGERMAVPWLDQVRFADTVGFHGDQNVNVFPYRDYVINAFNTNKPFDQFATEQLAGDLLRNPTVEQKTATGFNRLNMVTREGGAQPKEYLAKYMADRVRTMGVAFLGSTLACCECHDHKFDPFLARDFYSMGAYFADVKQWGVYMDYGYTPNPDLKGFSNDSPFPPEITVDSPYLKERERRLTERLDQLAIAAATHPRPQDNFNFFDRWHEKTPQFLNEHPTGWLTALPVAPPAGKADARKKADHSDDEDGSVQFTGSAGAATDRVEFTLPAGPIASLRLELLPSDAHGGKIVRGNAPSASVQVSAALHAAETKQDTKLAVFFADADHKDERYSNGYAILGVKDVWKTSAAASTVPQTAVYLLDAPAEARAGDTLILSLPKNAIARLRVSVSPLASLKPIAPRYIDHVRAALAAHAPSPAEQALLARTWLLSTAHNPAAMTEVRDLQRQIFACRDGTSPTVVTEAVKPYTTHVLRRGNWQDEGGPVVEPAPPHFLPQAKVDHAGPQTRLDLAKWLVAPENPLTSRVFVNRLWKQFFGAGLCGSVEDLGAQGEWPSHPELLDWLAVEFRDPPGSNAAHSWDVKHIVRLIVTSATYRQASNQRAAAREVDPANRLLSAQNPRRLEAEFVRDNALAAAGLINLDLGGPSCFPYQPAGYYANLQFPDRSYVNDADDRQYRRGVYMHWQRTFVHPMLANFDAPSREDAVCTRNVSNTPQQALTLLNDPEYVEAARVLAQRTLALPSGDDGARLDAIYRRALAREPKSAERESLTKFLSEMRAYYKANVEDTKKLLHDGNAPTEPHVDEAELAAWTNVCRVVLNLHETITRY